MNEDVETIPTNWTTLMLGDSGLFPDPRKLAETIFPSSKLPNPVQGVIPSSNSAGILFNAALRSQVSRGLAEYGKELTAFDGRPSVRDLFEELADVGNYAAKIAIERDILERMVVHSTLILVRLLGDLEEGETSDNIEDAKRFLQQVDDVLGGRAAFTMDTKGGHSFNACD